MLTGHDIAGYTGKEIEVYVIKPSDNSEHFLRGAQNCNPTEEQTETRVSELGVEATKVLYGTANYGASVTLLGRDLVQLARLWGIDPTTVKKILLTDSTKVNIAARYKDPDTGSYNLTQIINGWKARTKSGTQAVESTVEYTVEGGSDVNVQVDGSATVTQSEGNGTIKEFELTEPLTAETEVYFVERGAGIESTAYTFIAGDPEAATPINAKIEFAVAPNDGDVVRIVHKKI